MNKKLMVIPPRKFLIVILVFSFSFLFSQAFGQTPTAPTATTAPTTTTTQTFTAPVDPIASGPITPPQVLLQRCQKCIQEYFQQHPGLPDTCTECLSIANSECTTINNPTTTSGFCDNRQKAACCQLFSNVGGCPNGCP